MLIKNVKVFKEDKTFEDGEIVIRDGLISGERKDGGEVIDGEDCYAIPGLIDIHFHGCKGYDFCDGTKEAIHEIAKYEASIGVTAISPATMTLPVEQLEEILATAAAYKKEAADEADLIGVNMEGPFISKEKKGAQDATYIIPCTKEIFHRFQSAAQGLVKYIGVAPEREGALEFVEQVKDEVNVSLAHTNASYEDAKAAYDRGADHAVHLYNAMPPFTHRAPGVVGAVADSEHVTAELICDGVHIHPSVVRATFKMLGADRIILISDSMRATGMPDGEYTLGGLAVNVTGSRATLVSNGALAGSATNLLDCMRTVVKEMGIPLETAVACATMNPAKSLGAYDKYGSLTPGKKGNVVLLDKELNLKAVIKDGKRI
ncbi:N-acetylglucosamine-6-phosphate deacetylase [[Clostridium] hylemonae]|uniref:N-acetylglucosamine-6-phosphate deacetylase n=1 Tax=[Clostridium] hylemonae TaxID=89153 RepID=UPI001FCB108A|nr:N-acetylglucosamine-6-phosphate deacetylase [[Clostridium] hylemonae]BDF03710.1 N-acetylglucosamine-6-phosphate deacetylase [[Clostridium] hylemonae]